MAETAGEFGFNLGALPPELAIFVARLVIPSKSYEDISVYDATKGLVEYCHDESVDDVVFVDRKARSVWPGFTEYWRLAYAEEDRPEIHFLNPRPISNPFPSRVVGSLIDKMMAHNMRRQMENSDSSLYGNRDKTVMVFDVCAHKGLVMDGLRRTLERVGFEDLRMGVFTDDTGRMGNFDYSFTTDRYKIPCSPVQCDEGFLKPSYSIYVDGWETDPKHLAEHRQNMRQLIIEGFNAENKNPE